MTHPCISGPGGKPCGNPGECFLCWRFAHSKEHNLAWGGTGEITIPAGPAPVKISPPPKKLLGDYIADGLTKLGITKDRVSRITGWVGMPCGCVERQRKLNALHKWIKRKLG